MSISCSPLLEFWTAANVAHGLNALVTCVEVRRCSTAKEVLPSETSQMVFFAIFMQWAYPYKEYMTQSQEKTSIWRPLWDSINFSDFAYEIWTSWRFFFDYMCGKPHTRSSKDHPGGTSFGHAFKLENDNERSAYGWVSSGRKYQHDRKGVNEIQTTKDDSSEVEALHIRGGTQEAYRMKYISSQPGALYPPHSGNNGGLHV